MSHQGIQHFSYHHNLIPLIPQEGSGEALNCAACEQTITEDCHGCNECQYHLHSQCLDTPRFLNHPSHPLHPLTLLPSPTYSSRAFICNACRSTGEGFSFCCASCEFDLHLKCSLLPSSVIREDKHPHELKLLFTPPNYTNPNTIFVCDICDKKVDENHWIYHCAECDFGCHLNCMNGEVIEEEANEDLPAQMNMQMQQFAQQQARLKMMPDFSLQMIRNSVPK